MNPNSEQGLSALRTVLQIGGTYLAARYALDPAVVGNIANEGIAGISALVVVGTTVGALHAPERWPRGLGCRRSLRPEGGCVRRHGGVGSQPEGGPAAAGCDHRRVTLPSGLGVPAVIAAIFLAAWWFGAADQ